MSKRCQLVFIGMVILSVSCLVTMVAERLGHDLPIQYQNGVRFKAVVPDTAKAFPAPLARTGEQDITFRVSAEEAGNLQGLAERRNVRFKVTVE